MNGFISRTVLLGCMKGKSKLRTNVHGFLIVIGRRPNTFSSHSLDFSSRIDCALDLGAEINPFSPELLVSRYISQEQKKTLSVNRGMVK